MSLHPVLGAVVAIDAALKDVADVDPVFMPTPEKATALLALERLETRLRELKLRVLANADDVAAADGSRDVAAWLAHRARLDRSQCRRDLRNARAVAERWAQVGHALRDGAVNADQAPVITHALDRLPDGLEPEVVRRAEAHLVEQAAHFGPRQLRILGRRVLDVIAPEVAEAEELRALEAEETHAARHTFLRTRRRGDGTTEIHARVADHVADRLLTYLDAFTSPRKDDDGSRTPEDRRPYDQRPYDQRLGHAFGALLETLDPHRLPLHGGDATTVIVTLDHDTLTGRLEGLGLIGDQPLTAAQARRLACTATILPAVLGGTSEILDLGRARRLFSPAQRKAMALRDRTCRAQGCDIPAAWCEAHHAAGRWADGGRTNLDDGVLLCSWHHHRAHDHHYDHTRHPDGTIRFTRRT